MAITGRPLPLAEFVPYLLAMLGPDYNALVSFVTTRLEPISPKELLGHLLTHEARLLHHSDMSTPPAEASANFTIKYSSGSCG